jgi:hypothetical protein
MDVLINYDVVWIEDVHEAVFLRDTETRLRQLASI